MSVSNSFPLLISAQVREDFGNLFVDIKWECLEPVPAVKPEVRGLVKILAAWDGEDADIASVLSGDTLQTSYSVPAPACYAADKTQSWPAAPSSIRHMPGRKPE